MSNIIHLPGNIDSSQISGLNGSLSYIDECISGVHESINEYDTTIISSLYNLNNDVKAIERIKDNLNDGVLINKSLTEAAAIKDSIINDETIEFNWQNNCYPNNTNLTITTTTSGRCTWTKTLLPKGTKIYYNSKNAGGTASGLRLAYSINSPEEYYQTNSNSLIGFVFNTNIYHQTAITNSGVYIMPEDGYFIYFQSQTHEPIIQIDTNINRKPNTIYLTTDKHSIVVNGIVYSTGDFSESSFVYADESFSASSAWDTTKIYITPSNITGKFDLYYHNGTNWIKFVDTSLSPEINASQITYNPPENMETPFFSKTNWNIAHELTTLSTRIGFEVGKSYRIIFTFDSALTTSFGMYIAPNYNSSTSSTPIKTMDEGESVADFVYTVSTDMSNHQYFRLWNNDTAKTATIYIYEIDNVQHAIEVVDGKIDNTLKNIKLEFIKNRYPYNIISFLYNIRSKVSTFINPSTNKVETINATNRYTYWTLQNIQKGTLIYIKHTRTDRTSFRFAYALTSPDSYYQNNNNSILDFSDFVIIYTKDNVTTHEFYYIMPVDAYIIYSYLTTNVTYNIFNFYDSNLMSNIYEAYTSNDLPATLQMASIAGLGYDLLDYKTIDNIDMNGFQLNASRQLLNQYSLIYWWESTDGGNVSGTWMWYDRIQGAPWQGTNPYREDMMYKVGQDGLTQRYFTMDLNTYMVLPARHRIEVEFKYQISNNLPCYVIDFGSLTMATHAFSFAVGQDHKLHSNHKINGNDSNSTYNFLTDQKFTLPENQIVKAVIGATKVDSSNVILYGEYLDKSAIGGAKYTNTLGTFNNNWNVATGYIGRGNAGNTYWRGLMHIKSIKIYTEKDKNAYSQEVKHVNGHTYVLKYWWDSDDALSSNKWTDRIGGIQWTGSNMTKVNGMYKLGLDGSTIRAFSINANDNLKLPGKFRIEAEVNIGTMTDQPFYIFDAALAGVDHGFCFNVYPSGFVTHNYKANGNDTNATYGINNDTPNKNYIPLNENVTIAMGVTDYDGTQVILYNEYNGNICYGNAPHQYLNYNKNWKMANNTTFTAYLGRGITEKNGSNQRYWNSIGYIKSFKIYAEVE